MKLRRAIGIFAVFVMALGLLTGCGQKESNKETDAVKDEIVSDEMDATDKKEEGEISSESDGQEKILVVYYSASGMTKAVAESIAEMTDADLFEIIPKELYSSDDLNWTNASSRVSKEHADESLRNVELTSVTPNDWDSYDTVIIGYPIWWGIAAWPVDNFIKENDFTGKTVIPFCTSTSSGLGDSGVLLEKTAGTGEWQEGYRFRSKASEADIQSWVDSLNLNP